MYSNDNYPFEEVLYHQTSFEEAEKILDNGFHEELVRLHTLEQIDDLPAYEGEQEEEALLKVFTSMDKQELDYYATLHANGSQSWIVPSAKLNPLGRISFVSQIIIEEEARK